MICIECLTSFNGQSVWREELVGDGALGIFTDAY